MPPYAPAHRGRPLGTTVLFALAFTVLGLAGAVGTLYALGVELPYLSRKPVKPGNEGMVMVPIAVKAIPAYSVVKRDHILDPQTQGIALQPVPPQAVRPEMILDAGKIVGRVLRKDKNPGYVFTENDFYPAGTTPGITAGIPPGKRSFVFEADKIHGMASLRPGDRFDILATTPHDDKHTVKGGPVAGNPLVAGGGGAVAPAATLRKASVRPVVHNGVVLTPLTTRQVATTSSGLMSGTQAGTKPVHEITIAVDTSEVGPLSEALALDATLTCVARSGQPSSEPEPRVEMPPPPTDEPRTTTIETIVNGQRQVMRFPEPPAPPVGAKKPPEQAPPPQPTAGKTSPPPAH